MLQKYLNSLPGQGHKRKMIYSAPPTKPWNFALLIAKQYSSKKLDRAIKLAAVMANLCPFWGLFWASKKVQETSRWTLNRTIEGPNCSPVKI
ncbi:hypothetical protein COR50_13840 [Chitinophaga caeni]|uniref:Uncharacterized protein n=1 Tax=Chitinophaga caeni TaxID=2029983 RepID=A0A291QW13_9BACT|nr:hypothetical protein COR50_13840 [Chitinophaga caeni]